VTISSKNTPFLLSSFFFLLRRRRRRLMVVVSFVGSHRSIVVIVHSTCFLLLFSMKSSSWAVGSEQRNHTAYTETKLGGYLLEQIEWLACLLVGFGSNSTTTRQKDDTTTTNEDLACCQTNFPPDENRPMRTHSTKMGKSQYLLTIEEQDYTRIP
jgi:hypothetical protein